MTPQQRTIGLLSPLPELPGTWLRDLGWVVLVTVLSRILVGWVFHARGLFFPFADALSYAAHAEWLLEMGSLRVPEQAGGRFFHGVPMMHALGVRFTQEFHWTGWMLNQIWLAGAVGLFYRNFPRRHWALMGGLLLPGWVASTVALQSEAAMWLFVLVGMSAMRSGPDLKRWGALLIAGFAMACRPTAFLILAPMFAAAWWSDWRRYSVRCLAEGLVLGFFPLVIAGWSLTQNGVIFIQSHYQAEIFAQWAEQLGPTFQKALFQWPGRAFVGMIPADQVDWSVKFLNLGHLALWGLAVVVAGRQLMRDKSDRLGWFCLVGLMINGVFVLSIGGPYGGTVFYRYIATQANFMVLVPLLRTERVPDWMWWCAAVGSVMVASCTMRAAG